MFRTSMRQVFYCGVQNLVKYGGTNIGKRTTTLLNCVAKTSSPPSAGGRRIDYEVTADRQKPEFVRNHAAAASPDFGVFHPALGFFPAPFSLPFFSPGDCGL